MPDKDIILKRFNRKIFVRNCIQWPPRWFAYSCLLSAKFFPLSNIISVNHKISDKNKKILQRQ